MTRRYFPPAIPTTPTDPIARQAQVTYEDYKKIKGFEDVGYFLQNYVESGGEVTKNITRNDLVDVSDIVVVLKDDVMKREGASFQSTIPNATYYLDFVDGDFWWKTEHPAGTAGTDYLTLAVVTTDASKNIDVITDARGDVGGFKLKDIINFRSPYYDAQLADIATTPQVFGAKGDGVTDDTAAFERMRDFCNQYDHVRIDLGNYSYKLSQPDTTKYTSTSGFVFTSKWIKIFGNGARIIIPDGANYEVFWFLGDAENYESESSYMSSVHYDESNEYAEVSGIIFDFGVTGTGAEVAARFRYILNAVFKDNVVLGSNGNGVNFEQCESVAVSRNTIKDFNQYGIFVWMCDSGLISDNLIDGGATGNRGIIIKQAYNANRYKNMTVRGNTFKNLSVMGLGSGTALESGSAVYVPGHEKVWGVTVTDNRFFIPNGGFGTSGLHLGQFTNGWFVFRNQFIATTSASANAVRLYGSTADSDEGDSGDRIANHIFEENTFWNIDAQNNAIIRVESVAKMRNNAFYNCSGTLIYAPVTTYNDGSFSTPELDVDGMEVVNCTIVEDNFDSLIYCNIVPVISVRNIKVRKIAANASSSSFIRAITSGAVQPSITIEGVDFSGLDGSATLFAFLLNDVGCDDVLKNARFRDFVFTGTTINIIRSSGGSATIEGVRLDFTGNTSTNRRLIHVTSGTLVVRDNGGHEIINSTGSINAGTGVLAYGINHDNRVYYGTAEPSSGMYATGDVIFNSNPSAGGKVGWVCVSGGTPGTWKPFGEIDP